MFCRRVTAASSSPTIRGPRAPLTTTRTVRLGRRHRTARLLATLFRPRPLWLHSPCPQGTRPGREVLPPYNKYAHHLQSTACSHASAWVLHFNTLFNLTRPPSPDVTQASRGSLVGSPLAPRPPRRRRLWRRASWRPWLPPTLPSTPQCSVMNARRRLGGERRIFRDAVIHQWAPHCGRRWPSAPLGRQGGCDSSHVQPDGPARWRDGQPYTIGGGGPAVALPGLPTSYTSSHSTSLWNAWSGPPSPLLCLAPSAANTAPD